MTGWTPLFEQIIASSIWSAPDHIRIAWITMLACCRKDGICPMTSGGLARLANITIEQAEEALKVLSSPDPDTLTQEHDGRRIERVPSGWALLNWSKYREFAKKRILREQNREAQARYRAKSEQEEPSWKPPTMDEVKLVAQKCGLPELEAEKFWHFYESKGWKVGKNRMKSLGSAVAGWKLRWSAQDQKKSRNDGTLNSERVTQYDGIGKVL